MKLPADAVIAPPKLTLYLLVKRPAGDKSEFLRTAGYTSENWKRLESDIREQTLTREARFIERTR